MMSPTKKPTVEELIVQFKADNMAISATYERKEGEIVEVHNVPVVMLPGSYICIYEGDKITIVRWGKVLSIVFPNNEKMLVTAAVSSAMQMKQMEKYVAKRDEEGGDEVR